MRLAHFVGIIALSGFSAGAVAETAPPTKEADEFVCESSAKTGTRFRTKTCRTPAQWERMAEEAKRNYNETHDRPTVEVRKE